MMIAFLGTDGHKSSYQKDFILNNYMHEGGASRSNEKFLWNKETSAEFLSSCHFEMRDYMTGNNILEIPT